MPQRGFDQCIRGRLAVFLLQILLQRTGIDADPQWDAMIAGRVNHLAHAILAADIAWIDAQAVGTEISHSQGDAIVEMDVGNQRYGHTRLDPSKGLGSLHAGHGHTHEVCPGGGEVFDLRDGGLDVAGIGIGHRLDADRRIAAHGHRPDLDAARQAARHRNWLKTHELPTVVRKTPVVSPGASSTTDSPLYSTSIPSGWPSTNEKGPSTSKNERSSPAASTS